MSLFPRPAPEQLQQLYDAFWNQPLCLEEVQGGTQTFRFLDLSVVDSSYPALCGLDDVFLFRDEYDKFTKVLQDKMDRYRPVLQRFVLLGQPGIGDYSRRTKS